MPRRARMLRGKTMRRDTPRNISALFWPWSALALIVCALPLAGCGGDRVIAQSTTPPDYHVRHPIVIGEADYTLDVFPTGLNGSLDARSVDRLREFAQRYRDIGHGQVTVLVPTGGGSYDPAVAASVAHIRQMFGSGFVAVAPYPV